jgi:hypothetical protein
VKIGSKWSNKPVSTASVVEAIIIDFSCATAGPPKNAATPSAVIKASEVST